MRNILSMLPAIVFAFTVTAAQEKPAAKPAEATEKMLIANERALISAVTKADKASFLSLVVPKGIWAIEQGFVPMELLAGGLDQMDVKNRDIVNPQVQWIDENSAIVLYALTRAGTVQGQPPGPTTLASTVWSKRKDKWVAVHHQETEMTR